MKDQLIINELKNELIFIISETNGITLRNTLHLLKHSHKLNPILKKLVLEFDRLLAAFYHNDIDVQTLLEHPLSKALFRFFKEFPLHYHEEHIHLTGSLTADFIWPRLKKLIEGPNKALYQKKITQIYGSQSWPITSEKDVNNLIRLREGDSFSTYLKILCLPKLILTDRKAHEEAAYHMASTLYKNYNIGSIRLKFTLSRTTADESEQIPGIENLSEEDVVKGIYTGFKKFQSEFPGFNFILSPCFRKEKNFFDNKNFEQKKDHFDFQIKKLIDLINKDDNIRKHIEDIDTVGDEKHLYRKKNFLEFKSGFRKLQHMGIRIRSHHGETWKNLRKGIQSVDNAMNIWRVDTIEHGISLGINPHYYFHHLYQKVITSNTQGIPIKKNSLEYRELMDISWGNDSIKTKLLTGEILTSQEEAEFVKAKFFAACEIEQYQHDVLNRMIDKQVGLVALPTSNMRLTKSLPDYKNHPFSWWEKKGVALGVGTDNYITLSTNFIQEMLILLYSDADNLKIMKLLMIATKEMRRPYIGHLFWKIRQKTYLSS